MSRIDFIRKKSAFLLLVIFALGIAPQSFFHDAFAHHKDGLVCQHPNKDKPCIHRQAFHCGFEDWVITAPYLSFEQELVICRPPLAGRYSFSPSPSLCNSSLLRTGDRGPPSNV